MTTVPHHPPDGRAIGRTDRRATDRRRPELAAFLRGRRARITPEDVGMPPGLRRRTPGLRREEVAQLAGVGITWYTWLEQGRPINASPQVLDAVARTLRLDAAERRHLYDLAGVPADDRQEPDAGAAGGDGVPPDVQVMLDAMVPLPAVVYNPRYDVLGCNHTYESLFAALATGPLRRSNALWVIFTGRRENCPLVAREKELKTMVATLRAAYGAHAGEPAWERFLRELAEASPEFADMWASGDVVPPGPSVKVFRHRDLGELRLRTQSLSVHGMPGARMVVYVPGDEHSRHVVERLREAP